MQSCGISPFNYFQSIASLQLYMIMYPATINLLTKVSLEDDLKIIPGLLFSAARGCFSNQKSFA
jgi:hypothetical protein